MNLLSPSITPLPTLIFALKPLKEKRLVHLCESISENLGDREGMCHSRLVPLGKELEGAELF